MRVHRQPFNRKLVVVLGSDDVVGFVCAAVGLLGLWVDARLWVDALSALAVVIGAALVVLAWR